MKNLKKEQSTLYNTIIWLAYYLISGFGAFHAYISYGYLLAQYSDNTGFVVVFTVTITLLVCLFLLICFKARKDVRESMILFLKYTLVLIFFGYGILQVGITFQHLPARFSTELYITGIVISFLSLIILAGFSSRGDGTSLNWVFGALGLVLAINFLFAMVYQDSEYCFGTVNSCYKSGFLSGTDPYYWSVVNFSTAGFGDIWPIKEYRPFAISQGIIGQISIGILAAILMDFRKKESLNQHIGKIISGAIIPMILFVIWSGLIATFDERLVYGNFVAGCGIFMAWIALQIFYSRRTVSFLFSGMVLFLLSTFIINIGFAEIYLVLGLELEGELVTKLTDTLYFSWTTWLTIGYGDLVPINLSKNTVIIHAMIGYLMTAVLVGMTLRFSKIGQQAPIIIRREDIKDFRK